MLDRALSGDRDRVMVGIGKDDEPVSSAALPHPASSDP